VDDGVVERTKAGDAGAWRVLVTRHLNMVRAICTGYGLDEASAAEVNQVVWLRLVEHLPRIRTPDAVGGWIASTTRSECLSPRRAPARSGWVTADVGGVPVGGGPCCHRSGGNGGNPRSGGADGPGGRDPTVLASLPGLAPAFARLGTRCQRLLRLVATTPRPPDQHVSAALDIAAGEVPASCAHCLQRLCRMLDADVPTVWAELRRRVARGALVPPSWWDAAGAAFAWFMLDARLAELVYDSTAPSVEVRGRVRTVARLPSRQVRFSLGADGVELALAMRDGEVLLTGRLTPGRRAAITVHWPGGTGVTGSDQEGDFLLEHLPVVPLCIEVDGRSPFKTGWIIP